MTEKIDEKFDKAEKIVDRTGKLILKIVGAIVAVTLGLFLALNQLSDSVEEDEFEGVYIIEEYERVNSDGDTLTYILWSDGVEEEL